MHTTWLYGFDGLWFGRISLDFASQACNPDVDTTVKGLPVAVVRHIQELVTGEHAVRMRGEDLQEVKLHGGYRYLLALQSAELMGFKVQEALSKAQTLRGCSAC
jgi:hypothetical protein